MMNRWTNRRIGLSSGRTDLPMNFDQGEFDLSGNGSEEGYRKWQLDLDEKKRAFELRHGVLIGRRVRVQLIGELNTLEGLIYLVSPKTPQSSAQILLSLGNREFTPRQIESIVRIEDAGSL
jgi:hypothetical protein